MDTSTCGLCGSSNVYQGGSWTPEKCLDCHAVFFMGTWMKEIKDSPPEKPEGPDNTVIYETPLNPWGKKFKQNKQKIETLIGFDMILGLVFGFAWAYILFIIGISLKWIGNSLGVY